VARDFDTTLNAFQLFKGCRRRIPWLCGRRFRGNPWQMPQPPCRRRAGPKLAL